MVLIAQLAMYREYLRGLLDGLGLEAYLFELEPREGKWEIRLECAVDDGWKSFVMTVDEALLRGNCEDGEHKRQLILEVTRGLGQCLREADPIETNER